MNNNEQSELHSGAISDRMLPASSNDYITPVAHYYRGELSRMIAWRDRLDRTTNWAIAASAAMLSVTLSSPDSHHAVILCGMLLVFLLMLIEARRYRFFAVSQRRVRFVERNYHVRLFRRETPEANPDWADQLSEDLLHPRFHITIAQALKNRLRRNYLWIYLTLLVSWWLKISTVVLNARTGDAKFVDSLGHLFDNASVSYIPGELVCVGITVFFGWATWMSLAGSKNWKAGAEDSEEADV